MTGKQGVIIPMTTIQQLSLSDEVKSAVKNGEFFIYPVEDIYQACELLFERDLLDENKDYTEKTEPLSRLIQRRIEGRADSERKVFGVFSVS